MVWQVLEAHSVQDHTLFPFFVFVLHSFFTKIETKGACTTSGLLCTIGWLSGFVGNMSMRSRAPVGSICYLAIVVGDWCLISCFVFTKFPMSPSWDSEVGKKFQKLSSGDTEVGDSKGRPLPSKNSKNSHRGRRFKRSTLRAKFQLKISHNIIIL